MIEDCFAKDGYNKSDNSRAIIALFFTKLENFEFLRSKDKL